MAPASGSSRPDPPAPVPDIVVASRRHLSDKYASGVDQLFWELEKRPMPDTAAIQSVLAQSAASGTSEAEPADALDIGAALVLVQAMRLDLDLLEADVLDAAADAGVPPESVAAVLELKDAGAAEQRRQWLREKRKLPRAVVPPPGFEPVPENNRQAASRAGRRANQAAGRAAEAKRRKEQLKGSAPHIVRTEAEQANARASEARVNAKEAAERVALGLLRAADALERCAARCGDWRAKSPDKGQSELLRCRQAEYAKAAASYRDMAAQYRETGRQMP